MPTTPCSETGVADRPETPGMSLVQRTQAWLAPPDLIADPSQSDALGNWTLPDDLLPGTQPRRGDVVTAAWGDQTWRALVEGVELDGTLRLRRVAGPFSRPTTRDRYSAAQILAQLPPLLSLIPRLLPGLAIGSPSDPDAAADDQATEDTFPGDTTGSIARAFAQAMQRLPQGAEPEGEAYASMFGGILADLLDDMDGVIAAMSDALLRDREVARDVVTALRRLPATNRVQVMQQLPMRALTQMARLSGTSWSVLSEPDAG